MNYELAKKLKDQGFKQEGEGRYLTGYPYPKSPTENGEPWMDEYKKYQEAIVYVPTLSELIKACGNDFTGLMHLTDGTWMAYGGELMPDDINDSWEYSHSSKGSSPDEAVAELWLEVGVW